MSIDLSLIVPNKCRSLRDKGHAKKCFDEMIEQIIKYFGGRKQFVTGITIKRYESPDEESDIFEDIEYSFEIPILSTTVFMRSGYWEIWINSKYSAYFHPYSIDKNGLPRIWSREICFNVLLVFGCKEGWICDEYHSWNSNIDYTISTFEDWKTYGETSKDCTIYEFNVMDFTNGDPYNTIDTNFMCKFHDCYDEYHTMLDTYKRKFPEYSVLLIHAPLQGYALASKDGEFFLLNLETEEHFTEFPIDNCRSDFNGAGFQIFRGEESAFFNNQGKQLTDFRMGNFSWKWANQKHFLGQIIIDHATGKHFTTNGTLYVE